MLFIHKVLKFYAQQSVHAKDKLGLQIHLEQVHCLNALDQDKFTHLQLKVNIVNGYRYLNPSYIALECVQQYPTIYL